MDKHDQLRMVIIGCGYWGINYVRVFSELQLAEADAWLRALDAPATD